MNRDRASQIWLVASSLGLGALMIAYVFGGRINGDEGWYLWTSARVFEGAVPYRDFAFTQMPLSPYIFGLFQWIWPGIYGGRVMSVAIFAISVVIGLQLLRNRGTAARSLYLTLVLFNWKLLYYLSIPKLYGLLTACFLGALLALRARRPTLAVAIACTACLIRLSALSFLLPVIAYAAWTASARQRVRVLAVPAISILVAWVFVQTNGEGAGWGIWGHHVGQWGNADLGRRLQVVLVERLPELLFIYAPWILVSVLVLRKTDRSVLDGPLATVALGSVFYAGAHLVTGSWYQEYQLPALMVFTYVGAELLVRWRDEVSPERAWRPWALPALLVLMTVLYLPGIRLERTGGRWPVEEGRSVGHAIRESLSDKGRVFLLEVLWVAVDSKLTVWPSLGMAQFSLSDLPTEAARRIHLVNAELAGELLSDARTEVALLTDHDLMLLERYPEARATIEHLLEEHFKLEREVPEFGQFSGTLRAYVRVASSPL